MNINSMLQKEILSELGVSDALSNDELLNWSLKSETRSISLEAGVNSK